MLFILNKIVTDISLTRSQGFSPAQGKCYHITIASDRSPDYRKQTEDGLESMAVV